MSMLLSVAAWSVNLPALDKIVLLCLADHANADGRCWPSITRIGSRCGMSRASVMRALRALMSGGYIVVEQGLGRLNRYIIQATTLEPFPDSNQCPTATGISGRQVSVRSSTGVPQQPDPLLIDTGPVADSNPNLPRTNQEPSKNPPAVRVRHKSTAKIPPFHLEVIASYHDLCPGLPQVKIWTRERRKALDARIAERVANGKGADTTEYWRSFFNAVAASDFLCGRSSDFRADLEWLLRPSNFAKVIEGKYDRTKSTNGAHAHG